MAQPAARADIRLAELLGVLSLAADLGMGDQAATLVRRAGLVHDLGRLGAPNTIWDKTGRLSHAEAERVRLHPYLTERMLVCSPALAPLPAIAVQHRRMGQLPHLSWQA